MQETVHSILYVDDDAALRSLITDHLTESRFRVTTAEDGDVALPLMEKERFDLVILDIRMKRTGGVVVLQEMKKRSITSRVIMLTSVDDLDVALTCTRLGANDYVTKPFEIEELLASIRRLLRK
jgi:DNA-binding response OmpR family regulator